MHAAAVATSTKVTATVAASAKVTATAMTTAHLRGQAFRDLLGHIRLTRIDQ